MAEEKKITSAKNTAKSGEASSKNTHTDEFKRALELFHRSTLQSSKEFAHFGEYINTSSPKFNLQFKESLEKARESLARVKLRNEISDLETKLRENIEQLQKDLASNKSKAEEVDVLRQTVEELTQKREIQHLLDSVSVDAHDVIESNQKFRQRFSSDEEVGAYVVSVDIRRSTELMLKARSPKLFAGFITTLCNDLEQIFKKNWAVVDKFTGDGILAFFPEFFSGEDAGYLALLSASQANLAFERRYKEFRSSFTSILRDVGLGTGIDFGRVHLVRMAGALTIVGQPVVYACRLGGAPAGKILLNQPAFENIIEKYPHLTVIDETSIEIKSEGALLCYSAQLTKKDYQYQIPTWIKGHEQAK